MKGYKYLTIIILFSIYFSPVPAQDNYINGKPWFCEYYSNRISDDGVNLWIAASKGLIKYNKNTGEAYNAADEVYADSEATFTAIEVNSDGIICYSPNYQMPKMWDGAKLENYGLSFNYGYAYSFAFRSNGDVWGSTGGYYIPPVDSSMHNTGYTTDNKLSASTQTAIMDMKFDSKDMLWLAMYGQYDYLAFEDYTKDYVNSITYVGNNKGTPYKKITSIAIDKNDNIWYASQDGINCYYQATGQEVCMTKEQYPAMLENRYFGNDIDDNGNIWFTSENNLLKWDGSEFTTYTCDGYEEARSMLCDGDIVWVLLKNDTLLKFQNNEFEAIDLGPAITNTGINESIAETQNTKAFVTNEMLNIENAEGINLVVVYDAMGKVITSANVNGATSTQIALPSTIKGLLIVKVNNDVIKVACNN